MIAGLDFFTVPTVTFKLLYCLFVIEHGRRKILHFNVTEHPTAEWVIGNLATRRSDPPLRTGQSSTNPLLTTTGVKAPPTEYSL